MNPSPAPTTDAIAAVATPADWWMVWLTLFGIIATLLIAWLTFRANKTADRAQNVATQAYTAAMEATQQTSWKQIEALESLVDRLNERPEPPAVALPVHDASLPVEDSTPLPDVRWNLERDGKNKWVVRNIGADTARSAIVNGVSEADNRDLMVILKEPMDIAPGATIPFSIFRSIASPPATLVEVSWLDGSRYGQSTRFVVA